MCQALIAIRKHPCSVTHHDLKPDNIALEQRLNGDIDPVILDWGLAKANGKLDYSITERHLPREIFISRTPPEHYGMQDLYSDSVSQDIYALGTILFEMESGQAPFILYDSVDASLDDIADYRFGLKHNALLQPRQMPEEDFHLAMKMMAFDPLNRPRTFQEVIEGIGNLTA